MAPRDTLILSSDGLSDNLHEEEIIELIRKGPLRQKIQKLTEITRERMDHPQPGHPSKPDDTTILAFRRIVKKTATRKKRKPVKTPLISAQPEAKVATSEAVQAARLIQKRYRSGELQTQVVWLTKLEGGEKSAGIGAGYRLCS
ncbi:MAG: hypothetical protein R3C11_10465 [Planctomycetaceae bacterium]